MPGVLAAEINDCKPGRPASLSLGKRLRLLSPAVPGLLAPALWPVVILVGI